MTREVSQQYLINWNERQALAEKMIPLLGSLYRGPSVVVRVFGQKIMNSSTISIIKAHLHGRLIVGQALDMQKSFEMLKIIEQMDLRPCRLDLGKLCHEYLTKKSDEGMEAFLERRLGQLLGDVTAADRESHDVVLYGFGRIGRLIARLLIDRTGTGAKLRLRGVVVRAKGDVVQDLEKRAEQWQFHSVYLCE